MAVALQNSTFSKSRARIERRSLLAYARLTVAGFLAALVAVALWSGAWVSLGVVTVLFLIGTALLASGEEPLSAKQVGSIGTIHLLAGLLLAL